MRKFLLALLIFLVSVSVVDGQQRQYIRNLRVDDLQIMTGVTIPATTDCTTLTSPSAGDLCYDSDDFLLQLYTQAAWRTLPWLTTLTIGKDADADLFIVFDQSVLAGSGEDPRFAWDDAPGVFEFDFDDTLGDGADVTIGDANVDIPGTLTVDGASTLTGAVTAPTLLGKIDRTGTAVDDDECTGEQGSWWWDSTDNAFEFCNAASGAPAVLGGGAATSWDVTDTDNSPTQTVDDTEEVQFIGAGSVTIALTADGTDHDVTITGTDTLGSDGDKGDVTVGGTGTTLTVDSGAVLLNELGDPGGDTTLGMGANNLTFNFTAGSTGGIDLNATGNFSGDAFHVHQHTGNPTGGNLIHLEAEDVDINPLFHVGVDNAGAGAGTDIVGILIDSDDNDDTDFVPLSIQDDSGGTPDTLFEIDYTGTVTTGIWNAGITDGLINEPDLDADSAPNDNEILTYDPTGTNFDWHTLAELSIQPLDAELTTLGGLTEAQGSIIIGNATPEWSALTIGGSNAVLLSNATTAAWDTTPAIDCTDCTNLTADALASDALDNMGEIAAGLKLDDTDTKIATHSEASAPAQNYCVEMDTNGTLVLAADTCASLGPGGTTTIDNLGDAGGDGAVQIGTDQEYSQAWTWNLPATTTETLDGLDLQMELDATSDAQTQTILSVQRPATSGTATLENLVQIENNDTDGAATNAIDINAAAGTITTAIDISANVTNSFVTPNATLTMAELEILDAGTRTDEALCTYESTGNQFECEDAITGNAASDAVLFGTGANAASWDTTPAINCTDCTNIPAAASLNDVGDVTLTTPSDGGVLCFTGTSNNSVDCTPGGDITATEDSGTLTVVVTDTECTGDTEYLDGTGNCDDISSVYQAADTELTTLGGLTEAQGSLIIGDATPEWSALPIGGSNAVLLSNATTAAWDTTPAIDCTDCTNIPAAADLNDITNVTLTTPGDGAVLCFTGTSNNSVDCTVGGELTATEDSGTITYTIADSVTVTGWAMGASTATSPAVDDDDTSLATTEFVQDETPNSAGVIGGTIGTGLTIDDGEVVEDDLAASLAFDDGDLLTFASGSVDSATEGILLPGHATSCASATGEGQVCIDRDDDSTTLLWIGDGTTARNIGAAGGFTSFDIDGDNNSPQTITNGNEALFVGGVGIDTTAAATDQVTFDVDSDEAGFIEDLGAGDLTCGGSNAGMMAVNDADPLQYCDGEATPVRRVAAYGNDSGEASAVDTAVCGTALTYNSGACDSALGADIDLGTAEVTGTLTYDHGGTGQTSWAQGDMLYASAANTLATLTVGAGGTVLKGSATVPTYAALDLTADVGSSILPTANGGTGIAYFTAAGPTVARVYTFPDAAATIEYQANKGAANGYAGLDAGGLVDETDLDADVVLDNAANTYGAFLQDFDAATLEIESGTGATTAAEGEIAIDTTATYDQFKFFGEAERVLSGAYTDCKTIESLADADDNIPLMSWPFNVTMVAAGCAGDAAATIVIQDSGDNTIETLTCDTDTTVTWDTALSGSSFVGIATATEALEFDTTSQSSPTWLQVCYAWTVDAE